LKQRLVLLVLRQMNGFRASTVVAWPLEKLCTEAGRMPRLESPHLIEKLLLHHHIPLLATIQAPFFDLLGIPHNDGVLELEFEDVPPFTFEQLHAAVLKAWSLNPVPDVA